MEGLGVSLLQAAASGIPIVAFSAGGVPEIVRDGYNGCLIQPGDDQGLAAAAARVLTDAELAFAMGERGRRLVRQRFSCEAMVEGNKAVYMQLA
jgi:glycosyltransferase involved in cell wall biosynthesis